MSSARIVLAPGVVGEVVGGAAFGVRPEVWVNSPAVVVKSGADGRDGDDATVGSSDWLWSADEGWAFAAGDGALASLLLTLPEVNVGSDAVAGWSDAPAIVGTLRLAEPRGFSRPPTVARYCDPYGRSLFGLYEDSDVSVVADAGPRWRLEIAEGTHLLVAGETLAGWSIADPARYLTGAAVAPAASETAASESLAALFAEYCDLVTEDGVDRLEDGDSELRARLRRCAERAAALGAAGESRALEVEVKVRQVLEDFAGD